MFEYRFPAQDQLDVPDMVLPDVIPVWLLEIPPLPEPPCDCCHEQALRDEPEPAWAVPGLSWDRTAPVVRPGLSPAVLALQVAADRVCGLESRNSSPQQALVDGEALLRIGQRLRVAEVHRLGDVRQRELYALAGHRSAAAWLREQQPDADLSMAGLAGRLGRVPGSGVTRRVVLCE